jgi:hypothetical protein
MFLYILRNGISRQQFVLRASRDKEVLIALQAFLSRAPEFRLQRIPAISGGASAI